MTDPIHLKGSVDIDFCAYGNTFDVASLTEGWTDEEKRNLARGDEEARDELVAAAVGVFYSERIDLDAAIVGSRIEDTAALIASGSTP